MNPFYRLSDVELLSWSTNLSQKLSSAPLEFHITPEMAAELALAVLQFREKLMEWNTPTTRTPVVSAARKIARQELLTRAKYLVKSIDSNPETTSTQREELGIIARKAAQPTSLPDGPPMLSVVRTNGRTVTIRVKDRAITGARPAGTRGAVIFVHEGEEPPRESSDWKLHCLATRTRREIDFGQSTRASTVWISAQWYNARGELGPASQGVRVNLPAWIALPEAGLKAAA